MPKYSKKELEAAKQRLMSRKTIKTLTQVEVYSLKDVSMLLTLYPSDDSVLRWAKTVYELEDQKADLAWQLDNLQRETQAVQELAHLIRKVV